jgi:mRNA-degrading endonuclease toxin of MazEF toxin-antitoxin module
VEVAARESGLGKDGWIKADQVVTIDVAELGERAGRLSPGRLQALDAALRFVLALQVGQTTGNPRAAAAADSRSS